MDRNPLKQLEAFGQSIWLDYIRSDMIENREIKRLIDEDDLRGIASNPDIFEKAIAESHDYEADIRSMALAGKDVSEIYEALSQREVRRAADEFRMVYETTDGIDGYVSLEVSPHLANDTKGTIGEARRLWEALDRPNVLIKVPATAAGVPAIQQLISEGININATLLFGLSRYRQVAEAYISGLEACLARDELVMHVSSVASFFVSQMDFLVDPLLEKIISQKGKQSDLAREVHGQVAVASAKMAYQIYKEMFISDRFKKLHHADAHVQRLLWASTDTQNPEYSDVKYVESLIGPNTVNTVPIKTLNAFRAHGIVKSSLDQEVDKASSVLKQLSELGFNIDKITQELEDTSVKKSAQAFDKHLEGLAKKMPRHVMA
jgi:transaldolase